MNPATRARAAAGGAKAATAVQQPADKIIVSNLPTDVNEAQIKVRILCSRYTVTRFDVDPFAGTLPHNRRTCPGRDSQLRRARPFEGCRGGALPEGHRRHEGVPAIQQPLD